MTSPKRVVDFLLERDTFRNKILEIFQDFECVAKFLHFFMFFIFHFSSFFFFFLVFFLSFLCLLLF